MNKGYYFAGLMVFMLLGSAITTVSYDFTVAYECKKGGLNKYEFLRQFGFVRR